MFYNFGKTTSQVLTDSLDGNMLDAIFRERFYKGQTEKKYLNLVKRFVKTPDDYRPFCENLGLTVYEGIQLLFTAYPDIFKHHFINYVKVNYLRSVSMSTYSQELSEDPLFGMPKNPSESICVVTSCDDAFVPGALVMFKTLSDNVTDVEFAKIVMYNDEISPLSDDNIGMFLEM